MDKKSYNYIGKNIIRCDAVDKVQGRFLYLLDEPFPNALFGVILMSPHANATVKSIDVSEAIKIEGVEIFTYFDAPSIKYNSGEWFPGQGDFPDETILTGHPRHVGDRIALVMAETEEKARKARDLVRVEYKIMPAVVSLDTAGEMAGILHEDGQKSFDGSVCYGDIENAFSQATYIESDTVTTPKVHHAAMETHSVLAIPRPGDVIEVRTPCQITFGVQHSVAQVLKLPLSKIRVIKTNMGGTFGGKQEVVFEVLCAWAANKLKRPVFINTTREETIISTRTRAATKGRVETAIDTQGVILGRRFDITVDAGAYLTGTKKVMMAMGKKVSRLYRIPALDYRGRTVRTSTTPAGACRGYGSPQIHTITEIHTDLLCSRLGFDPLEFRIKNLLNEFEEDLSGGANIGKARVIKCLKKGSEAFGWEKSKTPKVSRGRFFTGSGFACCTHGNGYYKTKYHDFSNMSLRILEDGSAILRASIQELGSGATTALAQIVAEVTGIDVSKITVTETDTQFTSYDSGCQASRVIYVCGECARLVSEAVVKMLSQEASKLLDKPVRFSEGSLICEGKILEIGETVREIMEKRRVSIEAHYEHRPVMNPASFGAHFTEVTVDKLTGLVKINRYLAVHDIGQAINESFVRGQIFGGVQMGIGMALCEELPFDSNGMPKARNFDKYHLINAPDMPDTEIILIEDSEPGGPFGAKSIGEISTVPVSAAIVNAVNRALGSSLTDLPLTPAKIVQAVAEQKE